MLILTTALLIFLVTISALLTDITNHEQQSDEEPEHETSMRGTRLTGGTEVQIRDHPFMAALIVEKHGMLLKDLYQCGCIIISIQCALTAAHCLDLLETQGFVKNNVVVRSNNEEWRRGNSHSVQNWICHEKFNEENRNNDIGLVKVKEPFMAKNERPIAMAPKGYPYKTDTGLTVTGWGWPQLGPKEVLKKLNGVDVHISNQNDCIDAYFDDNYDITENMFCAGEPSGDKGACMFDLGGPAFVKNVLVGIVSWGIDCGNKQYPAVYTRVALYQDWIASKRERWKC